MAKLVLANWDFPLTFQKFLKAFFILVSSKETLSLSTAVAVAL